MRQQHRAGGKLFVAYAGLILIRSDGARGQVFVSALDTAIYTFVDVTADQVMTQSFDTTFRRDDLKIRLVVRLETLGGFHYRRIAARWHIAPAHRGPVPA